MPVYETGHARNVQRFQEMITFITSWGAAYDPSNSDILLTALNAKLTAANTSIDGVTTALAGNKVAINDRENVYSGIRKLTTRIANYFESTGAPQNEIDDLRALKRKIDGKRAKPVEDDPATPEDESLASVSASQQSYTQVAEHFNGIIQLVSSISGYGPNEAELDVPALQAKLTEMQTANASVMTSFTSLSNTRAARDGVMYAEGTGLVDLAGLVKKYTKAAFGTDSSQYDQIKALPFNRPNE